ncbi:hypothetical protein [Deinococcus multiflagellatus]|uniref:Uncharacterized protein n=1 Tax=Deinococcus multiflagellatus TaxID=1656887 RepID=A0ABW1ZI58_9DEIO|nr:hypothetical protein [Deinococcus multiflagellatus]MBZ9713778.1 hypothetical protein [Deinococcus multiflagellatus]
MGKKTPQAGRKPAQAQQRRQFMRGLDRTRPGGDHTVITFDGRPIPAAGEIAELVREVMHRELARRASAPPAPSIPDVGRRIDAALAELQEPLAPWQEEVLDLLHLALERGGPDALTPEFAARARDAVHMALYGRPAPRC